MTEAYIPAAKGGKWFGLQKYLHGQICEYIGITGGFWDISVVWLERIPIVREEEHYAIC